MCVGEGGGYCASDYFQAIVFAGIFTKSVLFSCEFVEFEKWNPFTIAKSSKSPHTCFRQCFALGGGGRRSTLSWQYRILGV